MTVGDKGIGPGNFLNNSLVRTKRSFSCDVTQPWLWTKNLILWTLNPNFINILIDYA